MPERDFTESTQEYLLGEAEKYNGRYPDDYDMPVFSSDVANEIAGISDQSARTAANFLNYMRIKRDGGVSTIETIWATVQTLDTRYTTLLDAVAQGVEEYYLAVVNIYNLISGKGDFSLSMTPADFRKKVQEMKDGFKATNQRIFEAKLDFERERLEDLGFEDFDALMDFFGSYGYADGELLEVLRGAVTESDVAILACLAANPLNYEGIPAIDPAGVSGQMFYALYLHSEVMRRHGNIQEIENMCNAFTANRNVRPAYVNAYLMGMAASAANAVQAEMMAWVNASMDGSLSEAQLNRLYGSIQEKQNLASFWSAIYALDCRKTSKSFRISTFSISGLELHTRYEREGFEFQLTDRMVNMWTGTFHEMTPRDVRAETLYANFDVDATLLENALRDLEYRKQELMCETIDAICASLTSIYPPLGLSYQIVKFTVELTDGGTNMAGGIYDISAAALTNDQVKALFPEACNKYGPAVVRSMIKAATSLISLNNKLAQVDKDKYEVTMDFWARQFGWGTSYTMGGHQYSTGVHMMNPQGLLGFTLLEGGGIMALYDHYQPGDHNSNLSCYRDLRNTWSNDPPEGNAKTIEMTELARKFILDGGVDFDSIPVEDLPDFTTALNIALSQACRVMEGDHDVDAAHIVLGGVQEKGE